MAEFNYRRRSVYFATCLRVARMRASGNKANFRPTFISQTYLISQLSARFARNNKSITARNTSTNHAPLSRKPRSTHALIGAIQALFTPLHMAAQQGHNQTARLLLMAQAKTEAKNSVSSKTHPASPSLSINVRLCNSSRLPPPTCSPFKPEWRQLWPKCWKAQMAHPIPFFQLYLFSNFGANRAPVKAKLLDVNLTSACCI